MKRAVSNKFITGGVVILTVLILILLPLMVSLGNYVLTLGVTLFIYIVLSESWNLMGGYTGQVNLGLSAYFGTGVLCYNLIYKIGVPFYMAMLVAGIAATVVACIIGPPTLRLRGAYFGIGTLAVAEVLRLFMTTAIPYEMYAPPDYYTSFSLIKSYYIGLTITIITIAIAYIVVHSRLGLVLQAIRDDEDAANASGINPAKYKMIVFIISSFLAGLAGGVFGFYRGVIIASHQFSPMWTLGPLVAATIGGWGTLSGPIWGSMVYVILQEVLGRYVRELHFILTGIIFILVIMFLPYGLANSGVMIRGFLASLIRELKILPLKVKKGGLL